MVKGTVSGRQAPPNPGWSRPGKPGEIVGRVKLASSLILGMAWTVWHLPLFFMQGSYQYGLGLGTEQFWLYMMDKVPLSVLMTWIFNNNRRSTLSVILFHFMVNLIGELFDLTLRAEAFTILLWIIVAIGVTILWGPERLVRDRGREGC